jgi:1,4-dihydroxy-2-naphthoate octaprenyltransferase
MNSLLKKPLLQTFRPPFLVLGPICVLLGIASASIPATNLTVATLDSTHYQLAIGSLLLCVICAHISVNTFNEYFDFRSGLDTQTQRTPFSGGSGTLPTHPHLATATLYVALISLLLTLVIGTGFIIWRGLLLLPIAILGTLLIISYTTWITRQPWLCLLAPGMAFGPLMIMGTAAVLTGHYSLQAFCASLPVFFLVNNLLLLNQLPDIAADKHAGRVTLPIYLGTQRSIAVYGIFLIAAFGSIIISALLSALPVGALPGLIMAIPAFRAWRIAKNAGENIEKLLPALKLNVLINLLTPGLMALGIFFS